MNYFRYGVGLWALAWIASAALQADETPRPCVVLSSKIATDGDFVTLPVKVGGQSLVFVVDTGAPTTALDSKFAQTLALAGEKERSAAIPYRIDRSLYLPPAMTVMGTESGEIPFPPGCAVACRDLSFIREASSFPVQGVLGMDFLENYAVELDLVEGRLQLLDAATLPKQAAHDAMIEMEIDWRQPNVETKSGETVMQALIDTGALASLYIQREPYEYLAKDRQLRERVFEIDVNGEKKVKTNSEGWLRELRLGPFAHRYLYVDGPNRCCLLGLYYWRRYKCIFDFPAKTVYLDKSPFFDVRDDSDHCGIYVEPVPGVERERRIAYVALGSEAHWLKLQPGDRLISIDGKAVESESVASIYRRLSFRHQRKCELVIARDGRQIPVVIPSTVELPQP